MLVVVLFVFLNELRILTLIHGTNNDSWLTQIFTARSVRMVSTAMLPRAWNRTVFNAHALPQEWLTKHAMQEPVSQSAPTVRMATLDQTVTSMYSNVIVS